MSTIKANTIQPINAATGLVLRTNEVDRLNINTSGDVGIGVSPSYKLHVSGTCAIVPNTNVGMRIYEDTDSANFLRFRPLSSTGSQTGFMFSGDDDSPHLTIKYTSLVSGSPRIGIGTDSPAVALDVNGEARSSTSTTSSSNAKTLVTKDYTDNRLAFAWVVFADNTSTNPGTDGRTCTIISSKNVSSVVCKTDLGYAYYEITFTDPCVDANYFATGQFMRRKGAAASSDAGWPLYLWPIPPYNANYGYTYTQQAPEEPSGVPSGSIAANSESQPRPSTNKVFRCLAHRAHGTGVNPGADLVRMGMVAIYR